MRVTPFRQNVRKTGERAGATVLHRGAREPHVLTDTPIRPSGKIGEQDYCLLLWAEFFQRIREVFIRHADRLSGGIEYGFPLRHVLPVRKAFKFAPSEVAEQHLVAKLDADLGTKGLEAAFTANVAKSIHAEGSAAVAEKRDIERQKAMGTETKERYLAQIRSVYRKYRKEIRGMEGMEIADIPKLKLPRPDSDIADDSEVKRLILACWRGADELRAEVSSTVMPKGKKNGGNAGSGGSQRAQQVPAQERPEPNKENGER